MSRAGLLVEVDDELWGETESDDSNWVGKASTEDGELLSGVWSIRTRKYYHLHQTLLHNVHV